MRTAQVAQRRTQLTIGAVHIRYLSVSQSLHQRYPSVSIRYTSVDIRLKCVITTGIIYYHILENLRHERMPSVYGHLKIRLQ